MACLVGARDGRRENYRVASSGSDEGTIVESPRECQLRGSVGLGQWDVSATFTVFTVGGRSVEAATYPTPPTFLAT
jgi:hypothetical protein